MGQLLTDLYSTVDLPISMLALKTLGEVIAGVIQSVVLRIEKHIFKKVHVHKIRMKTFIGTCLLMVLLLLLGTLIEVLAEGWSFVEGIYTWFVIFSTIGFGDYVPFQSLDQKTNHNAQKGLCVVSAVLTSLVQAGEWGGGTGGFKPPASRTL